MSGDSEAGTCCCASCGIAEIDDIKLVPCDGCDLVRYCGDECMKDHKSEHEEGCKKRAAELREELLFKQPESSHMGDCPICMIPLPLHSSKTTLKSCCGKLICNGCWYANSTREKEDQSFVPLCPFCRKTAPKTDEEDDKLLMKRVEANDPVAMSRGAAKQYTKGDYRTAFEYWKNAAEMGDAKAHYGLSHLYQLGHGVEKDSVKEIHHLEEAAIGGYPEARYELGVHEMKNNNNDKRATKHWVIAAKQGCDNSIKALMKAYKEGFVEKDVLAAALRAHKAAVDTRKSPQRQEVEEFFRDLAWEEEL